jgi:hypothetical protein
VRLIVTDADLAATTAAAPPATTATTTVGNRPPTSTETVLNTREGRLNIGHRSLTTAIGSANAAAADGRASPRQCGLHR